MPRVEDDEVRLELVEHLVAHGHRARPRRCHRVSNVNAVTPPNAAMYWSCLPMGSLSMSISIVARLFGELLARYELALVRVERVSSATVNVLDEPSPQLAGTSATRDELDALARCR